MKIVLLLLLLAASAIRGEERRPVQPEHSILFWKVEGKGISGHLLASTPFIDKKSYPLPTAVEKAFRESSALILPMSVSPGEEKRMGALTLQKGIYIGEKSLPDDLSPAAFAEMEKMLKESGQDASAFAKVKPWMVGIAMTVAEFNRLGYNPEDGLVPYLQRKGKNKETAGLMSYSEWISLLGGFSREESELYLRMSMQYCRIVRKKHGLLRVAWMRGDLETLDREFRNQWSGFPDLQNFQRRLDERSNRLVYGRLDQVMRTNPGFFMIFDIDKICGENGLRLWLEKNGYRLASVR